MKTGCHKADSINSNKLPRVKKQETPLSNILFDHSWTKPEKILSHSGLDPPLLHEISKNKSL